MSNVNVPLLRKAIEWAEAEAAKPPPQSEWHQGGWKCRPRAHAMLLAEEECIGEYGVDVKRWNAVTEQLLPDCGTSYCVAGYVTMVVHGMKFDNDWYDANDHVAAIAADLLGIEPPGCRQRPEKGHLFCAANTIQDLRRIAEDLAGERL